MLTLLRGQASERKLRLFAAACCRRAWNLLPAETDRQAIQVAERFADGLAGAGELAAARRRAARPAKDAAARRLSPFPAAAARAAAALFGSDAYRRIYAADGEPGQGEAPHRAARELGLSAAAAEDPRDAYLEAEAQEAGRQAPLLRDIFGNPFRPSPPLPREVLAWHGGTVVRLARAMYEARDFTDMPLLADALLDAGCDGEALVAHCRRGGEHARGCWAVDLVLGKS
jgi:hypothetical protein